MPTTARDIIKKSLQKIGVLIKSEAMSDDEAQDGLYALNALISSWSNDSLVLYSRTWETFNNVIIPNDGNYTIGIGQEINTIRPNTIVSAYVSLSGTDYELTVVDDEFYNSLSMKTINGFPCFINFDNGYPVARIRLYPVPQQVFSLTLITEKAITQLTSLDTVISFPNGWERALIFNLALDLAPEYSRAIDPYLLQTANKSLGMIRTQVAKVRSMDSYVNVQARFNIYSGTYV
jgi:hypothetical protein